MGIQVYNTLSNQREAFHPIEEGEIKMYACGVTVYDLCHIGHAMQAIIYDVIRNYFEFRDFKVTYVRNYTDVDDKIIQRAQELGIPALEHSENMIKASEDDLELLDVKPATHQPKISDHIPEVIELVQSLIDQGGAYEVGGDVYYKVNDFDGYGKLSNRSTDEMRSGARVEVNEKKSDPLDFVLWKRSKPGEVSWPSPWGEGRPGWHIECSAMAMKFLGESFDIHGGGKDLIFPHHENEIAQSERATQKAFANYWLHNGLVTVDGRKMSKSTKNFMTIRDAVAAYYPEAIRFTILCHNYSSNIDFSDKSFYDAYSRLIYFYTTLKRVEELETTYANYPKTVPDGVTIPELEDGFTKAMDDDFNSPVAISEIGAAFKFMNDFLAAKKPKLKQKVYVLVETAKRVKRCAAVFNLLRKPPVEALANIQDYLIRSKNIDIERVKSLVQERNDVRAAKNWARADELRDILNQESIALMDGPNGTEWFVTP